MHVERLRTYARLGLANLARVGIYRFGLKSKLHPVLKLKANVARGPFFRLVKPSEPRPAPNTAWDKTVWRFGWHQEYLPAESPDWFANPFADTPQPDATRNWWEIPDFAANDIKGLWELSRMGWAVAWATQGAHGDEAALSRLNAWLADWATKNPPYKGPNWKCAQEASIRVMHLVTAAWVLGQDDEPQDGLVELIGTHLQRIALTTSYAIGQANNHGTSEAAALFIGGSFLMGRDDRAASWAKAGRDLLEDRAQALIECDGSFSQYSVTYHRIMLDAYSLAEAWRRHKQLPEFSSMMHSRLDAAARWLQTMTCEQTGDAPNIGANDGARILQLTDCDYRDFRPCVQLACALFSNRDAFGEGPWNDALIWLGVPRAASRETPASKTCDQGGYHMLRANQALAVMRYPRFRFRPSQADGLHVDLWCGGVNLLRDAGTYSYNRDGAEWFSSAAAHNTVTFDGHDQMVRLGRFLFGTWLKADDVTQVSQQDEGIVAAAAYTDRNGARHHRRIMLSGTKFVCTDTLSGEFRAACLRWRLPNSNWQLNDDQVHSDLASINIKTEGAPGLNPSLSSTAESRYYLAREDAVQLSVSVTGPTVLTTEVSF